VNDSGVKILGWLTALAAIALIGWHNRELLLPDKAVPIVDSAPPAPAESAAAEGPRYPIDAAEPGDDTERSLVALPPLDDSDAFFLLDIASIFGQDIESLLLREGVIDRLVATVDNLPRRHVSEQVRPVGRLPQAFVAVESPDADARLQLGEDNYRRYDALVAHIAAADTDAIAEMYRRYYPLFQQSYERLGYPDAYFNDRLVEVIDLLLETPDPAAPPALVRPNVLYEFADPDLERLASGQKLLLRMGSEHAATIKQVLRALRERIAAQ